MSGGLACIWHQAPDIRPALFEQHRGLLRRLLPSQHWSRKPERRHAKPGIPTVACSGEPEARSSAPLPTRILAMAAADRRLAVMAAHLGGCESRRDDEHVERSPTSALALPPPEVRSCRRYTPPAALAPTCFPPYPPDAARLSYAGQQGDAGGHLRIHEGGQRGALPARWVAPRCLRFPLFSRWRLLPVAASQPISPLGPSPLPLTMGRTRCSPPTTTCP